MMSVIRFAGSVTSVGSCSKFYALIGHMGYTLCSLYLVQEFNILL